MEQGLVDIRKQAKRQAEKSGKLSPYMISCSTLIAILDELEDSEKTYEDVMYILRQMRRPSEGHDYETLSFAIALIATRHENTVRSDG